MRTFDIEQIDLSGQHLIEASAGTGKTFTLAEIYLRMVVESGLTVDQILVVTFTNAATAELRDRLRQKLAAAREAIAGETNEGEARDRIDRALYSFDEAAIFTIHGFCYRVLTETAFESGQRFDLSLIQDDFALLTAAVADFWRQQMAILPAVVIASPKMQSLSPKDLLNNVRSLVAKTYVTLDVPPAVDMETTTAERVAAFERAKSLWQQEHEVAAALLKDTKVMNQQSYKVIQTVLEAAAIYFAADTAAALPHKFELLTQNIISGKIKKGQDTPELRLFSACDKLLECQQAIDNALAIFYQRFQVDCIHFLRETLPQRKQQQQVLSNDDLLLELEQALQADNKQAAALATRLRDNYRAALIDEFQDTDPVQYGIFSAIYAATDLPMVMVGDPKQAIYRFRGADIFTYLTAKQSTANQHTLATNWRSHPQLVAALNHLFTQQPLPFGRAEIPYVPVVASREDDASLLLAGKPSAARFECLTLQGITAKENVDLARQRAVDATADQIATLLSQAERGDATVWDKDLKAMRPLCGGDIAVLVGKHKQAKQIQTALRARGVYSVQHGADNVFTSREATMLVQVLQAVAQPRNGAAARTALITPIFGLLASDLLALNQDAAGWDIKTAAFSRYHQQWQTQGFMPMCQQLLADTGARQHILASHGGERCLTNLLHLAELVQGFSHEARADISQTVQWLVAQRQQSDLDSEAYQLRLESDEQLVQIVTIHKSKGLEYAVVFCPFLWDTSKRKGGAPPVSYQYHDGEIGTRAVFYPQGTPQSDAAKEAAALEEQEEAMRLLYVALTRARELCVVVWGDLKGATNSALARLLGKQDVEAVADKSGGTMACLPIYSDAKQAMYQPAAATDISLAARDFKHKLPAPWRIGSFSGLTRDKTHDLELPDHDATTESSTALLTIAERAFDRFGFPRGASAGTCLHSLFEVWDFVDLTALKMLADAAMVQYGFDAEWSAVAQQWLREVVATPLNAAGLTLADITPHQRLDELAFYFPVVDLSATRWRNIVGPAVADTPLASTLTHDFHNLSGFMKGFIDLVFERDGQYFVVDYKSNYLGANLRDYDAAAMMQAMAGHHYPLQYAIYSLALHRYLRLRLPDYDPAVHFGGVYYLFIRGMHADTPQAGVFFDRPTPEVLDAIDVCMQGAEL